MKKIMAWILCPVFFVSAAGCASWSRSDRLAAGFFVAGHAADAITTERHQDRPDLFREMNPILGDHPSEQEIAVFFVVTAGLTFLLAHLFPKIRKPLLLGYGATGFAWAIHNDKMMDDQGD